MNTMTKQYGPVVFSHRVHAQMSEMSGGCYGCHHYNDTALNILSCRTGHPTERKRTTRISLTCGGRTISNASTATASGAGHLSAAPVTWKRPRGRLRTDPQRIYAREEGPPAGARTGQEAVLHDRAGRNGGDVLPQRHAKLFGKQCVDCHREEDASAATTSDRRSSKHEARVTCNSTLKSATPGVVRATQNSLATSAIVRTRLPPQPCALVRMGPQTVPCAAGMFPLPWQHGHIQRPEE